MNIYGLQKITLLDYPGLIACTVFTGGCNMRCPYCHNSSLAAGTAERRIPEDEIFDFLKKRQKKLEAVCISGGEPLLQQELENFIREVRRLGYKVKLDTNGCMPERLAPLLEAGLLDYVAMDLKNSPEKYGKTIGINAFDIKPIDKSIRLLMEGDIAYEFRTTVVKEFHRKEDFEAMGQWIRGADQYFLQQFADSEDTFQPGLHAYEKVYLDRALEIVRKYVPTAALRGI